MIARAAVGLALLLLAVAPAAAQRPIRDPEARTTLRGVVVDKLNGDPLPNAVVRMVDENRGLLSDSLGRFLNLNIKSRYRSVRVQGPKRGR